MIDETIFENSGNEVVLILIDPTDLSDVANYPNGKPYDFIAKGVTLMELFVGCHKFSSTDGKITYDANGRIVIKLGGEPTNIEHDVKFNSFVKVYDPAHPKGQFINDNLTNNSKLTLTVIDPSTC